MPRPLGGVTGGYTQLSDTATAGSGAFTNNGSAVGGASGGFTIFTSTATAGDGIFTNGGGAVSGATVGLTTTLPNLTGGNERLLGEQWRGGSRCHPAARRISSTPPRPATPPSPTTAARSAALLRRSNVFSSAPRRLATRPSPTTVERSGGAPAAQRFSTTPRPLGTALSPTMAARSAVRSGGSMSFDDSSTAANGTFTNNGGTVSGACLAAE